uniref:Transposase n=1 Tax=Fervidicoccus fontis TaxID=683846 RepID=A0A7J3SK41_9CREN
MKRYDLMTTIYNRKPRRLRRGCEESERKAFLPHRDLNASINIPRRAMSSSGWGKREPPEPADEAKGEKPQLNAGSLVLQDGVVHLLWSM